MKEKVLFIKDLHFEHEMWKKELHFCYEELTFLTKSLEEAASFQEEKKDVLREVEHFQNQFIVQRQNIDPCLDGINTDKHKLIEFAKKISGSTKSQPF